jgi:hypothetical protein
MEANDAVPSSFCNDKKVIGKEDLAACVNFVKSADPRAFSAPRLKARPDDRK